MKKFNYTVFLLILLCFIVNPLQINQVDALSTYKGMCVLEGNTLTVLDEFNAHKKLAMASTTKIITAIVTIENCDNFNKTITVADQAVG